MGLSTPVFPLSAPALSRPFLPEFVSENNVNRDEQHDQRDDYEQLPGLKVKHMRLNFPVAECR
jgi:hypothetical protein